MPDVVTEDYHLSPSQWAFWTATETYVDFEGAVRAGKTTPAVLRVIASCQDHPGINWMIARWTQDSTDAQLKARFKELCPPQILRSWNSAEQYFEIGPVGDPQVLSSRVYCRGLKPSEEIARYGKFAGLTLAGIYIDQPEELPEDFYHALKARLSQPGYPHQLLLTPNPPALDHWIAREFPESGDKANHRYIRTTVYDNRTVLGEQYIADLEAAYPEGTALRRRFIDGRRGLAAVGEPVYKGYFHRNTHERALLMNRDLPLLEAWDFGHSHPCVIWGQLLPWGALHLLGGVMGLSLFIEDFAPMALGIRAQWFPNPLEVWSTGDPAGTAQNSQGTNTNAERVLNTHGVQLSTTPSANHPDRRNYALQVVGAYMRRLGPAGPAFGVDPRFLVVGHGQSQQIGVLADALEAGYVWDEKSIAASTSPNTRRPKKDGYYDHCMNCLEYLVLAWSPAQPTVKDGQKESRKALRIMQRDYEPTDRRLGGMRRGGY